MRLSTKYDDQKLLPGMIRKNKLLMSMKLKKLMMGELINIERMKLKLRSPVKDELNDRI